MEGCRSNLCEKSGAAHARHGLFQVAGTKMVTLQDTAEHISQGGGASVKTYLENGRKCWTERKEENNKRETAEGTSKSEEEKEMLHGRSDIPGEQPMEDLYQSRRKEKEGIKEINNSVLTTTTPAPSLCQ